MRLGWCWVLWLCLGMQARAEAPLPGDCRPVPEQVLEQINRLRAQAHRCGGQTLLPAGPLQWDPSLARSARRYAEELARRDLLSHRGEQAATLRERLRSAGYLLRTAGENLAAGPVDLEETLALWLDSPEHCDNLMQPDYEHMGLACVAAPGRYGRFWVLHMGRGLRTQAQRSEALSPDTLR